MTGVCWKVEIGGAQDEQMYRQHMMEKKTSEKQMTS
jgi:hypothetical protein